MNNYIRRITVAGVVALTAAVMSGCSDDSDNLTPVYDPADYITFGTPSFVLNGGDGSAMSRSTLVDKFGDGGVTSFNVWGYCVPRTIDGNSDDWNAAYNVKWPQKSSYSTPDVFNNQVVTVDGSMMSYTDPKQWKAKSNSIADVETSYGYTYTFIACANGGKGRFTMSPASGMGVPVLKFEMPFRGGSLGDNPTPLDHKLINDALIAAKFDHTRRNGKVDLVFSHILTGIRFRFHNHTSNDLTIRSLSFQGRFYRTGEFDFSGADAKRSVKTLSEDSFSGRFDLMTEPQTIPGESSQLMGYSIDNPDGTTLLLLPNPAANPTTDVLALGDNKTIIVNYTLNGEEREWRYENFKLSYVPGANVRHTANLNFVGNEFTLIFQADNDLNWEDGSDNDIDIN